MSEWYDTTLGDFITLQRGHDLPQKYRRPGKVPVVGSGGPTGFHDSAKAKGPGITIGRAANLGVPALMLEDFWPLNTTLYVTDFHNNDVIFAYYLLKTIDLTGFNSGSVQPMLNRNYVRNYPLRVPDIRTQKLIAMLLGALDDKIAVNDGIIRTLRAIGDTLARRTVTGATKVSIQDLIDDGDLSIGDGYRTKRAELGEPGLPILRVAEVQAGCIAPRHDDFVRAEFRERIGAKISTGRDVILTTKGTVGRVAIVPDNFPEHVYSPQVCYFRVVETGRLNPIYLFYWFRSESFQQQALPLKGKTDMADYLNLADIKSLQIEVPNACSAAGLLERLEALEADVDFRLREVETLAKLRDTLLPKLMSGQVRIRDAERVVEDAV